MDGRDSPKAGTARRVPGAAGSGPPPGGGEADELGSLLDGLARRVGGHLLGELSPLEVECWASRFWEACTGQELPGGDAVELFGGGVLARAAALGSAEGLALLRALAAVVPAPYAAAATARAGALAASGVAEAAWSASVGLARPTEAWLCQGAGEDRGATVLVAFDGPGHQAVAVHASAGGVARDVTVLAAPVAAALSTVRAGHGDAPVRRRRRVALDEAAAHWQRALAPVPGGTPRARPAAAPELRGLRTFVAARLRTLPAVETRPAAERPRAAARAGGPRSAASPNAVAAALAATT